MCRQFHWYDFRANFLSGVDSSQYHLHESSITASFQSTSENSLHLIVHLVTNHIGKYFIEDIYGVFYSVDMNGFLYNYPVRAIKRKK